MTYRELDRVVLIRDIPDYDLRRGDLGAVVHVYGSSGLEVEFVRLSGLTQALITLAADDVRPVGDHDVPAVREVVGPVHGAV
jgi:hypothetical protein